MGGNRWTSEFLKQIFSVIKAERVVWATVVQLFSFVWVDVVHHQKDIFLCEIIKAAPFRKNTADQFMVHFTGTLLIRGTGITVKYLCPQGGNCIPILDFLRIWKFASIIRKDYREKLIKCLCSKNPFNSITISSPILRVHSKKLIWWVGCQFQERLSVQKDILGRITSTKQRQDSLFCSSYRPGI